MSLSPSEQDLQDFAWERLDDPVVEGMIRHRVHSDPDTAARVEAMRAIKAALHQHYDRALDWPVPDRLAGLTETGPRRGLRGGRFLAGRFLAGRFRAIRGAAVGVGVFMLGVASGFWLDQEHAAWRSPLLDAFERRGLLSSGAFTPLVPLETLSVDDKIPAMGGMIERLQRLNRMQGRTGLTVQGAQTVRLGHIQGVRVLLHGADGQRASLFVQPRWTLTDGKVDILSRDDISLATWADGPFSFGLAAAADQTGMGDLAVTLRSMLRSAPQPQTAQHLPTMVRDQATAPVSIEGSSSPERQNIVQ